MNQKRELAYFLDLYKNELCFKNAHDFRNEVNSDFNFRFKIQKFVFLAKYFGWDNSYQYCLYPRGPYSSVLADDYYSDDIFNLDFSEIDNFNQNEFRKFIEDKSEYDLEAASTILFYRNFKKIIFTI